MGQRRTGLPGISGVVIDQTSALIPGVTSDGDCRGYGYWATTLTDETGSFSSSACSPGIKTERIADGFSNQDVDGNRVAFRNFLPIFRRVVYSVGWYHG
jgi:hypothetical protein